ncbi:hypothetical protein [Echinicola vietnamensis]|uniref:Uncharacterized protein n=1 Tax=Echinicola vietnamensis (strain DSM 17526 / LMG 23754 / KMM 6221) TaxID=926556 RepID=L0FZI7_ECHVK|nr:hypothetical protein [Echinicola vietnamensis]AGA78717.1 hypothetical protein Echvi_2470 [Echinicola vietnamensis DSM 17526]
MTGFMLPLYPEFPPRASHDEVLSRAAFAHLVLIPPLTKVKKEGASDYLLPKWYPA